MAALVVLDTLVRAEYLKPFWGCWAYPAPSPTETRAFRWMQSLTCFRPPEPGEVVSGNGVYHWWAVYAACEFAS